jgi:hypothetical protein
MLEEGRGGNTCALFYFKVMEEDNLLRLYTRAKEIPLNCNMNDNHASIIMALCREYNARTGMNLVCSKCNAQQIVEISQRYLNGIGKL